MANTAQMFALAEGYADGAVIDLANGTSTDFSALDLGTGSIIATRLDKIDGIAAYHVKPAQDSTATFARIPGNPNLTTTANNSLGAYVRFTGYPSGAMQIFRMSSGGGGTLRLAIGMDTSGRLVVVDSLGATTGRVATTALPLNQWHRLEIGWSTGTGATDRCSVKVYPNQATVRDTSLEPPVIDSNFTTTAVTAAVNMGKCTGTTTTWADFFMDYIQWSRASQDEFGPFVPPPAGTGIFVIRGGVLVEATAILARSEM